MWTQCVVLAAALSLAAGQDPPRRAAETFRVTTERIQFDALFLDPQNRPVTDIRADEVTIRQRGAVVPLSDLRFRSRSRIPPTTSRGASSVSPNVAPPSGAATTADGDADAWVFLIDDLAMSPDAFGRAKSGLLALLQREVPPGAAVGILRTGVIGTHQTRLSDDRADLLRTVAGMRYGSSRWRGSITSRSGATVAGPNSGERIFVEGTLGSLNSLLLNLRQLSGRKVVILMSEMIALSAPDADIDAKSSMGTVTWNVQYNGVAQRMRRLGRLASHAGVTVHTVDLAGVVAASSREQSLRQEGLHAVADELGGMYFGASNDAGALLERVVAAEQGHYVLAYEPPAGTFDDGGTPRFVDVSVAVSRPGVTVKTRKGFFTR